MRSQHPPLHYQSTESMVLFVPRYCLLSGQTHRHRVAARESSGKRGLYIVDGSGTRGLRERLPQQTSPAIFLSCWCFHRVAEIWKVADILRGSRAGWRRMGSSWRRASAWYTGQVLLYMPVVPTSWDTEVGGGLGTGIQGQPGNMGRAYLTH